MKNIVVVLFLLLFQFVNGQTVTNRIKGAINTFSADSQLQNALVSLYIIDAKSGKTIYEKNSLLGMAPAS
ncbi:MAG TPA: D-alanyl-D-alanine carboxypeptidase/D-alanyl-D-alanine-endopeptidase, partial [Flavisolibacter sp.]|nr:D-alanyl-D-alanine carboxypeptidase/D-alanyl-D-alanine-endopeptidase [Flavisolibacter sp.]